MTNAPHRFSARMSALAELLACARAACCDVHADQRTTRRIELALEELFTNTVKHGYCGDSESPVWLWISPVAGRLCVTYEDAAPPYNPLDHEVDLDHSQSNRPPGGLGVHLARCLADEITYRRAGDRNIVTLAFVTST